MWARTYMTYRWFIPALVYVYFMVDHTEKCPLSISGCDNSYEDPQHTILSQIWRRFQKNYRKWRPKPSWVKTFLIFDLPGIGRHFQLHPPKEQVILHLLYQGERLKSCCTEVIEVSWYPPGGTSISPRGYVDFPPGGRVVVVPPGGLGLCLPIFGRPPGGTTTTSPPGGKTTTKIGDGSFRMETGRFKKWRRTFPEW